MKKSSYQPVPEFVDSEARAMLKEGLARAKHRHGTTLREVAKALNFKQQTVISHMANGRIGIPIDRAYDIAVALDIDPLSFTKAVLKQRHAAAMAAIKLDELQRVEGGAGVLELAASVKVPLTAEKLSLIDEMVRDVAPSERWLSPREVYVMNMIRRLRPSVATQGLSQQDLSAIESALP